MQQSSVLAPDSQLHPSLPPDAAAAAAPHDGRVYTAQLLLVKKGSRAHVYPKLIDLHAKFEESGKDEVVLGRGSDVDITLPAGELVDSGVMVNISRTHCKVKRHKLSAGGWAYSLHDLRSMNGTFLNWTRISTQGANMRNEDQICFGAGAQVPIGGRIAEDSTESPTVSYVLYTALHSAEQTAPRQHTVTVATTAPPVAEYSQISVHSFDGQLELMRAEEVETQKAATAAATAAAAAFPAPDSASLAPPSYEMFSEDLVMLAPEPAPAAPTAVASDGVGREQRRLPPCPIERALPLASLSGRKRPPTPPRRSPPSSEGKRPRLSTDASTSAAVAAPAAAAAAAASPHVVAAPLLASPQRSTPSTGTPGPVKRKRRLMKVTEDVVPIRPHTKSTSATARPSVGALPPAPEEGAPPAAGPPPLLLETHPATSNGGAAEQVVHSPAAAAAAAAADEGVDVPTSEPAPELPAEPEPEACNGGAAQTSEFMPMLTPVETMDPTLGLDRSFIHPERSDERALAVEARVAAAVAPPFIPSPSAAAPPAPEAPATASPQKRKSTDTAASGSAPKRARRSQAVGAPTAAKRIRGTTGARVARAQANGLPKFRSGFDILCGDRMEAAREAGTSVSRPALVKAWRNLDVAGKDAYEKRAAAEREELLKKHPELALLNPNQEDEDARIARVYGGRKPQEARDKQAKEQGRAKMRAARARLFEDLDKSAAETRDMLCDAEANAAAGEAESAKSDDAGGQASVGGGDAASNSDMFIDASELPQVATKVARQTLKQGAEAGGTRHTPACLAISERLLGAQQGHMLVLPKGLAELLKRHQVKGVQFLWRNLVTLPDVAQDSETLPGGCILAHGMGLGKSFTTIAFVILLMRVGRGSRFLIVAPKSTLRQWAKEFEDWCEASRHECPPVHIIETGKHVGKVKQWGDDGGVLLLSYAMLVRLINLGADVNAGAQSPTVQRAASPRSSLRRKGGGGGGAQAEAEAEEQKEMAAVLRASQFVDDEEEAEQLEVEKAAKEKKKLDDVHCEVAAILQAKCDLLIVDEGHKINSPNSALTRCLRTIKTLNRVVLTGTPMQNNMRQYHTMIDFVRPESWGYSELVDLYTRAAKDPSARVELAHAMSGFLQRYDCSKLREELPPLTEYVLYVKPSSLQRVLYSELMSASGGDKDARVKASKAITLGSMFLKLCSHTHLARQYCMSKGVRPLAEQIKTAEEAVEKLGGDTEFAVEADTLAMLQRGKVLYADSGRDFSWALPLFDEAYIEKTAADNAIEHNPKLRILLDIIEKTAATGEKIAVFCESTAMLDIVEQSLSLIVAPATRKFVGTGKNRRQSQGEWRKGKEYHRLDGTSSVAKRAAMCDDFNSDRSRSCLILVSTRSGGLGINLVGATRVVLYGVGWNAQSDLQAIYRTYRYGQSKPVTVYRLVTQGSVEQTLFARTVAKLRMSMSFVDDKWSRADLKSFDVIPPTDWAYHAGRDAVLQVLHEKRRSGIHSVLVHDSLRVALDAVEEEAGSSDSDDDDGGGINVVIEGSDDDDAAAPAPAQTTDHAVPASFDTDECNISPPLLGTPQNGPAKSIVEKSAASATRVASLLAAPASKPAPKAPQMLHYTFGSSDSEDD